MEKSDNGHKSQSAPHQQKHFLSPPEQQHKPKTEKNPNLKPIKNYYGEPIEEESFFLYNEESNSDIENNYIQDSLMGSLFKNKILKPINDKREKDGYHKIDCETYRAKGKLKIRLINPNNFNNKYTLENIGTTTIPLLKTMTDFINQDDKENPIITSEITTAKSKNGEVVFAINNRNKLMEKLDKVNDESVNHYQTKVLAERVQKNLFKEL